MEMHVWIDRGLRRTKKKAATLARLLGIEADKISKMRKGTRQPQARELPIIEAFLGEKAPVDITLTDGHLESSNVLPSEPEVPAEPPSDQVRELEPRAGTGAGGIQSTEVVRRGDRTDAYKPEGWSFPSSFLRNELRAPASRIVVLETRGDSMEPTIATGERVVVDRGHVLPSPDGIYAMRDIFGEIIVKRLQVLRSSDPPRIKIISDNPNHVTEEVAIADVEIVGKVICGFKRY